VIGLDGTRVHERGGWAWMHDWGRTLDFAGARVNIGQLAQDGFDVYATADGSSCFCVFCLPTRELDMSWW
jgi:hypothetical protein